MKLVGIVRSSQGPVEAGARDAAFARIEASAASLPDVVPGVKGLVLSRVVRPFAEDDPLVALVEVWHDSLDADGVMAKAVPADLRDELDLVVTSAACTEIVFREVKDHARPGSAWTIKLAGTAFRRDDFTPDAFFEYWTNTHAPIGGHLPGIGGYTVSRRVGGRLGVEEADAIIEQWYVDEEAFNASQTTDGAKAAWEDVGNYAKTTGTAFWLLTESVVVTPPATGPGTLGV
jgi:uncharacterized protein (TIGR02118 family)